MDKAWWYGAHMLAIATHVGLMIAGGVVFSMSGFSSDGPFDPKNDFSRISLAWGSGAVGMLGLVLNIAIFLAFKNAEEAVGHSAYFQRKMTTIGAACVAMILVIGEIFMAKALGRQGSLLISGLCGITSLAATFTVLSVIADIVKLLTFDAEDADEDRLIWESQRIQLE